MPSKKGKNKPKSSAAKSYGNDTEQLLPKDLLLQMMRLCDDVQAWTSIGPLACVTKLHDLTQALCAAQEALTPLATERAGGADPAAWEAFWSWADATAITNSGVPPPSSMRQNVELG